MVDDLQAGIDRVNVATGGYTAFAGGLGTVALSNSARAVKFGVIDFAEFWLRCRKDLHPVAERVGDPGDQLSKKVGMSWRRR